LALSEDLRMNRVLETLLQTLAQFVPYERAQLLLLETDSRLFLAHEAMHSTKSTHGLGFPETLDISDFPILDRALFSQEGLLIDDVLEETTWKALGKEPPVRSWIGVPIVYSDQVLGLLSLAHSIPAQFSHYHRALARSLAPAAAVAIQNARLYERANIYGAELNRCITEVQEFERASENARRESDERFEEIFRSVPVAISVSSLVDGRFIEINEAFERSFGATPDGVLSEEGATELDLWEDPRERTKLLGRLVRQARVCGSVARLRQRSGLYRKTMYSAEVIHLDGQPCLLLAAGDQTDSSSIPIN
jgi:PAS domain S-box-containing protein